MQPVSCTNTHHVTDLVNHGMVKNTKTWIPREWDSLSTKFEKMLINLCLRWHILRSYRFVGEITFKVYAIINCLNENLIAHSRVNTGCFQHQYTDFGHTWAGIWACPNLILSKTEPTIKHNSSFLTKKISNIMWI